MPASTPVAALKVTPVGSAPDSPSVGTGNPVAVTVKVPEAPRTRVLVFWLVMAGAWLTVSVKFCVAFGVTPFCAVMTIG